MTDHPPVTPSIVPILAQGEYLIASVQSSLTDADIVALRDRICALVTSSRSLGVVIDVAGLDVLDSFAVHTFQELAQMVALRGASTVIVGIRPDVAFAMVQWGLSLTPIPTVLDLDAGLEHLHRVRSRVVNSGRTRRSLV